MSEIWNNQREGEFIDFLVGERDDLTILSDSSPVEGYHFNNKTGFIER